MDSLLASDWEEIVSVQATLINGTLICYKIRTQDAESKYRATLFFRLATFSTLGRPSGWQNSHFLFLLVSPPLHLEHDLVLLGHLYWGRCGGSRSCAFTQVNGATCSWVQGISMKRFIGGKEREERPVWYRSLSYWFSLVICLTERCSGASSRCQRCLIIYNWEEITGLSSLILL